MYHYYTYDGRTLCSAGALPYPEISALPETGEVLWVFHRPPLAGRDTFPVTDPAQLTEREGVASLCAAPGPEGLPRELTNAIRAGRVRAVNLAHPRFEELMAPPAPARKGPGEPAGPGGRGQHPADGPAADGRGRDLLHRHLRPAGGGGPALGVRAEPDPAAGALRRPAAGGDRVTGAAV